MIHGCAIVVMCQNVCSSRQDAFVESEGTRTYQMIQVMRTGVSWCSILTMRRVLVFLFGNARAGFCKEMFSAYSICVIAVTFFKIMQEKCLTKCIGRSPEIHFHGCEMDFCDAACIDHATDWAMH